MRRVSWHRIRRAIVLGAIWGFISSCAVFPDYYFISRINHLEEFINSLRERFPSIQYVRDLQSPEFSILYLISLIVFLPAVPFPFFGLAGVFLSILTGAAIRVIIELLLEMRKSRHGDVAE
ncbi:MAG: hypothetical protein NZ873_03100 [Crenarchaeota archaeon]|nr:hypothetical protein [Thermoproteota archaeon]